MTHILPNPITTHQYTWTGYSSPPDITQREGHFPYLTPRDLTITEQELMKHDAAQAEKDKRIIALEKEIETFEEALVEAEQEVLIREARIDILLSLLHNASEPKEDMRQLELPLVVR